MAGIAATINIVAPTICKKCLRLIAFILLAILSKMGTAARNELLIFRNERLPCYHAMFVISEFQIPCFPWLFRGGFALSRINIFAIRK
jgi:hypothetical protein